MNLPILPPHLKSKSSPWSSRSGSCWPIPISLWLLSFFLSRFKSQPSLCLEGAQLFYLWVYSFPVLFCLKSTIARSSLSWCLHIMSQSSPLFSDSPVYPTPLDMLAWQTICFCFLHSCYHDLKASCMFLFLYLLYVLPHKVLSPIRKRVLLPFYAVSLTPSTY